MTPVGQRQRHDGLDARLQHQCDSALKQACEDVFRFDNN
jgi:hypothetical protein